MFWPDWAADVPEYPASFPPPNLAQVLQSPNPGAPTSSPGSPYSPPMLLGALGAFPAGDGCCALPAPSTTSGRRVSAVFKVGADTVQRLLPAGCVLGGWLEQLEGFAGQVFQWPRWEEAGTRVAMATQKDLRREEDMLCLVKGGIQDCSSARCRAGRNSESLTATVLRVLALAMCAATGLSLPRHSLLPGDTVPGAGREAYEPLRAAPRLRLSPGRRLPGWGFEGPHG